MKENLSLRCLITDIIMEDNSLLRAKLDKKGVPEKEYYEIQTEKGYSEYENLYSPKYGSTNLNNTDYINTIDLVTLLG